MSISSSADRRAIRSRTDLTPSTTDSDHPAAATGVGGPFRVLLTCGHFEPGFRAGGPVRAVARLLDTCSDEIAVTLLPLLEHINAYLVRWIRKKYKRLRPFRKAQQCWQRITRQYPRLFAHWAWTPRFW